MTRLVQETIDQALDRPSAPRVWVHVDCGGWVLFRVEGGRCLTCKAAPLHVGEYEFPERAA